MFALFLNSFPVSFTSFSLSLSSNFMLFSGFSVLHGVNLN